MIVRTDLALLESRITVPAGIASAIWTVVALGEPDSTVPGPTDTRLYAFLQPAAGDWAPVESALGAAGAAHTETLPATIATAILPPAVLAGLPQTGPDRQVTGPSYDPTALDRNPYHGIFAVRLGAGLLVCLQTQ